MTTINKDYFLVKSTTSRGTISHEIINSDEEFTKLMHQNTRGVSLYIYRSKTELEKHLAKTKKEKATRTKTDRTNGWEFVKDEYYGGWKIFKRGCMQRFETKKDAYSWIAANKKMGML